jgi:hypothetical protein
MFLVTINKAKRLMYLGYFGQVVAEDLQRSAADLETMLAEMPPGFRLLADFTRLESMDTGCVPEIGKAMELFDRHQMGLVVRVMPDPGKDIGFNIIAAFHYKNRPPMAICDTLEQAAGLLSL